MDRARGLVPQVAPVLRRLLRRKDLPDGVRRIGAERTLEFVRNSSAAMDVSLLLLPLLKNTDPEVRAAARAECLSCMSRYGDKADAWYLLQALLQPTELDDEQSAKVISQAISWLDDHPKAPRGYTVLTAC